MKKIHEQAFEKAELKNLLEVIQYNLAFNIDSMYEQSLALIDSAIITRKKEEHTLGWKKEDLKRQIENYLKIVVKNIAYFIEQHPDIEGSDTEIINYLRKAVK